MLMRGSNVLRPPPPKITPRKNVGAAKCATEAQGSAVWTAEAIHLSAGCHWRPCLQRGRMFALENFHATHLTAYDTSRMISDVRHMP